MPNKHFLFSLRASGILRPPARPSQTVLASVLVARRLLRHRTFFALVWTSAASSFLASSTKTPNLRFFGRNICTSSQTSVRNPPVRHPYSARSSRALFALSSTRASFILVSIFVVLPQQHELLRFCHAAPCTSSKGLRKTLCQALCTPRTSYSLRQFVAPRKQICAYFVTFILHRFCTHTFVNKQACDGVCVVCMCVLYQCAHSTYIELRQASDS